MDLNPDRYWQKNLLFWKKGNACFPADNSADELIEKPLACSLFLIIVASVQNLVVFTASIFTGFSSEGMNGLQQSKHLPGRFEFPEKQATSWKLFSHS